MSSLVTGYFFLPAFCANVAAASLAWALCVAASDATKDCACAEVGSISSSKAALSAKVAYTTALQQLLVIILYHKVRLPCRPAQRQGQHHMTYMVNRSHYDLGNDGLSRQCKKAFDASSSNDRHRRGSDGASTYLPGHLVHPQTLRPRWQLLQLVM